MSIDTTGWRPIGDTSNARYFEIEPGVLAVIPGARDDRVTAIENIQFQHGYLRALDRPGAFVVFMDGIVAQDRGARSVYQSSLVPGLYCAAAMVATKLLPRAIASFFLGLSRPEIPIDLFPDADLALAWVREIRARAPRRMFDPTVRRP